MLDKPVVTQPSAPKADAGYLGKAAVNDAESQGGSAVESALVWSEKYLEAVDKITSLQEENKKLKVQIKQEQKRVASLESQVTQNQKELKDANALLIEMHGELKTWKDNVLGFRDEMRTAQKAQLDAMAKVLKLLGGEVPQSLAKAGGQTSVDGKEKTK